jgi:hypothetical protein
MDHLFFYSAGQLHSFSVPVRMKHDASKLGIDGLVVVALLDLLLLVMQLVILSEYLCSRPRGNNLEELGELYDCIQGQMV